MAEEITPGLQEWRRLYESAVRIKEISPWEWMTETDVFGQLRPEAGRRLRESLAAFPDQRHDNAYGVASVGSGVRRLPNARLAVGRYLRRSL